MGGSNASLQVSHPSKTWVTLHFSAVALEKTNIAEKSSFGDVLIRYFSLEPRSYFAIAIASLWPGRLDR